MRFMRVHDSTVVRRIYFHLSRSKILQEQTSIGSESRNHFLYYHQFFTYLWTRNARHNLSRKSLLFPRLWKRIQQCSMTMTTPGRVWASQSSSSSSSELSLPSSFRISAQHAILPRLCLHPYLLADVAVQRITT